MTTLATLNYFKKKVQPSPLGTGIFIATAVAAYITIDSTSLASQIANHVAIFTGLGLLLSIASDSLKGWRNLFRVDVVCLVSLYFLVLAEFIVAQPYFDTVVSRHQVIPSLGIVLLAMVCIAIGRHINLLPKSTQLFSGFDKIPDKFLFRFFVIATILAYFYMLLSVNFNIFRIFDAWLGPRFAVPWGRGRLGDWRALISELKLFAYAIPPLAGVIWNRRKSFKAWQLIFVIIVLLLTLFDGFSTGTRNVFASYLVTFLGGYLLTLKRPTFFNVVIPSIISGYVMILATQYMLAFRTIGIRQFLAAGSTAFERAQEKFSVDYNLHPISLIVDKFSQSQNYLGFELLFVYLTKPIPRVFWPGKPEGLSTSIEQIVGAQGWTVSATYIGEAYMMGGVITVIIMSLLVGITANWWTRTGSTYTSNYGLVVNAIGFFIGALTMRSFIFLTTSMLPLLALIFYAKLRILKPKF